MDYTRQALVYVFLFLPALFSMVMFGRGVSKISNNEPHGDVTVGFAILFMFLIVATYIFVIR